MNETEKLLKEGDKFLELLDSILELISNWKENYVPTVEEKDSVPDTLDFEEGDTVYTMTEFGDVDYYLFTSAEKEEKTHRVFKTSEMAITYRDKTQVIADMLHFKQLYDAEFKQDFTDNEPKFGVACDSDGEYCCYRCGETFFTAESVYFSSEEVAQKCADWLNAK